MLLKTWSRAILASLLLAAAPALVMAQVSLNISVNVPPPELPVYDQPPVPGDGYLWTPGYWAWGDDIQDYYWVPGTWVAAPQPGYLWTPGYWGSDGGAFLWHIGYWGPHVGFYGGVSYGYGYGGEGFEGGYWQGGHLYYNRSVTNITNTNITNVYNKTVINNVTVNRVSYNGGSGGVRAQPTAADQVAAHEKHIAVTEAQRQQEQTARSTPSLRAKANGGHPAIAATAKPGAFSGSGVVAAHQASAVNAAHSEQRPAAHAAATQAPRVSHPAETPHPAVEAHPEASAAAQPHTAAEPRRQPEAQPPRQAAPPHPAPHPAPRPAEHAPPAHAPEHEDEHEHH